MSEKLDDVRFVLRSHKSMVCNQLGHIDWTCAPKMSSQILAGRAGWTTGVLAQDAPLAEVGRLDQNMKRLPIVLNATS